MDFRFLDFLCCDPPLPLGFVAVHIQTAHFPISGCVKCTIDSQLEKWHQHQAREVNRSGAESRFKTRRRRRRRRRAWAVPGGLPPCVGCCWPRAQRRFQTPRLAARQGRLPPLRRQAAPPRPRWPAPAPRPYTWRPPKRARRAAVGRFRCAIEARWRGLRDRAERLGRPWCAHAAAAAAAAAAEEEGGGDLAGGRR